MLPTSVDKDAPICCDARTRELYGFDFILGHSIKLTGSDSNDGDYDIAVHHNTGVTLFVICPSCMPQRVYHFTSEDYEKFLDGQDVPAQTISRQDLTQARLVSYDEEEFEPVSYDRERDAKRIIEPLMHGFARGKSAMEVSASPQRMYADARPNTYYSLVDPDTVSRLKAEFKTRYTNNPGPTRQTVIKPVV